MFFKTINLVLVGLSTAFVPVFSQSNAPVSADPVLLTIGGKPLKVSEFQQNFSRHQYDGDTVGNGISPRQYLDLFVNYKLKVRAAEARGMDTTQAFREELATYRQQSAQSYLTDKSATDALLREAYERTKEEVNASHLLINVAPNASPSDTLAAYRLAISLRDRALKGESFTALAKQYSQDPSATQNSGDLGWFSAFQLVYPFENAAYRTPKGQITMPVRTNFGYHLIKVNDRRPAQGQVKVAHVFIRLAQNSPLAEQTAAKNRINDAYAALQRGDSFARVVSQYTDDASSRNSGGEMPAFGTGAMTPPFEKIAFALKKVGAYSAPFQTTYGWHIVKLIQRIPLESYEKLSGSLRQRVLSDSRSALSKQVTLTRIKRENRFTETPGVLNEVLATATPALSEGKFSPDTTNALAGKILFTQQMAGGTSQPTTVRDFLKYIAKSQSGTEKGSDPTALMRTFYNQFTEQQAFKYEESHLEEKNPEFKALMQEFHDGILLFQEMEDNVLNKSLSDSLGQQAFYSRNSAKYPLPERIKATVISAANKTVLEQAKRVLAKQPYAINRKAPDLQFAKGQTVLTDAQKEILFNLIVIMAGKPDYVLEVTGNADTSEDDSVSVARARNVVRYLTSGGGIGMTRIVEIDEGKFKPASKTDRDKNRRVGFVFFTTSKEDVATRFNQTVKNTLVIKEGNFKKGDEPLLDAFPWKLGRRTLERAGRSIEIDVESLEPARPKSFTEARGAVISDYQTQLEKDWLASLRRQFPVEFNDTEVRKLN